MCIYLSTQPLSIHLLHQTLSFKLKRKRKKLKQGWIACRWISLVGGRGSPLCVSPVDASPNSGIKEDADTVKTIKESMDKYTKILQEEKYEPVCAKWTTERCAVCRWVEDWDYNKIIICNRCQIAVHQECYGARNVRDLTSWVCRVCETPDIGRKCCLCPVKGGALKPTDIDTSWVHMTCAWFRPEVSFASDEEMEPVMGILSIPSSAFVKVCIICKQIHGACTQCCKCSTYYHAMCASRAGYRMEAGVPVIILRCADCLELKDIQRLVAFLAKMTSHKPLAIYLVGKGMLEASRIRRLLDNGCPHDII